MLRLKTGDEVSCGAHFHTFIYTFCHLVYDFILYSIIGDEITTEWRGKWCSATVVAVDCSLARVHFVEQNIYEWIYRGSTRCENMYI